MVLERCRTVLGELEVAKAELATTSISLRGRLRVRVPMVSDLLTPLIGEFMKRYPEIELDLEFNDRFVDVIDDGFDAVIPAGAVSDNCLLHVKLSVTKSPSVTDRTISAPPPLAIMVTALARPNGSTYTRLATTNYSLLKQWELT